MEKTSGIPVVNTVLIRPVIDLMEFVSWDVKVGTMDTIVSKVSLYE